MLTQEQYNKAKTAIDNSKSIESIVQSLEEADSLYLKGRWNSSRICQEASNSNDGLAVKLYCLAEFRKMVIELAKCVKGDFRQAEMIVMQNILMKGMGGMHGFYGF